MYKVFNQSKAIIITKNAKKSNFHDSTAFYDVNSQSDLSDFYHQFMMTNDLDALVFNAMDSEIDVFKKFSSLFKNVYAAGGLISDEQERIFMIYRYYKWDLPKGRIEKGEKKEDAAIRESEEETGVRNLKIIKQLQPSYYIFSHFSKVFLKTTYWYRMKSNSKQPLTPQLEEHIEIARWMNKHDQKEALKNTYPSILELMMEL